MSGQASSSKSKPVVIPFTDQELELMGINIDQAMQTFENVTDLSSFNEQLLATVSPILDQLGLSQVKSPEELAFEESQRIANQGLESQRTGLLGDVTTGISDILGAEGGITDADRALLDTLEADAIRGVRDSTSSNLDMLRRQLAPSLGLRGSDAPIIDRGGLIAQEGISSEADIRAARAASELALPGQRLGELNSISPSIDASNQFQQGLRQDDFSNQLAFLGEATNTGLGLANVTADSGLQAAIKPTVAQTSKTSSGGGGL